MTRAGAAGLGLLGVPHLPGRTPRPPEAAFAPLKAALGTAGDTGALAASAAFAAAQDLFERRYYWEAHELYEAVWMRLLPAGPERVLLRGLIQLANAGLKARMGRAAAARRILALADAALAEAAVRGGGMGLNPERIARFRAQAAEETADA